MTKIKTIDVQAKEWFDRINGNSYFAGIVTVNYGMADQREYKMPFQYGSKGMHEQIACDIINKEYNKNYSNLWRACQEDEIILRTSWSRGHKQRELKEI